MGTSVYSKNVQNKFRHISNIEDVQNLDSLLENDEFHTVFVAEVKSLYGSSLDPEYIVEKIFSGIFHNDITKYYLWFGKSESKLPLKTTRIGIIINGT